MQESSCDQASEILQCTNDGDDLAPEHLRLLELAVNGQLNEMGLNVFAELHATVVAGKYQKPWLQGIEHLTRDHEGYVYWKGQHIEHWSGDLPYSAKGKADAEELARRCQIIESRGEQPSPANVVWHWQE